MSEKMPTITINGEAFSTMTIEHSARKHWGSNSDAVFSKFYQALDQRLIEPDNKDNFGRSVYVIASCISGFGSLIGRKDTSYRDTAFTLHPETETIRFFHGSPRKKNWYFKQSNRE